MEEEGIELDKIDVKKSIRDFFEDDGNQDETNEPETNDSEVNITDVLRRVNFRKIWIHRLTVSNSTLPKNLVPILLKSKINNFIIYGKNENRFLAHVCWWDDFKKKCRCEELQKFC